MKLHLVLATPAGSPVSANANCAVGKGSTSQSRNELSAEIEKATRITGIPFEGKTVVLKEQVSAFFEVTPRTIDNYIEKFGDELRQNGYEVLRDNRLKTFKVSVRKQGVNEIDFVNIKVRQLGIFDFRAFWQ